VPPPLPSGRIRVAELATSMLWAAPMTALLSIPAASLLGISPFEEPQQLAFLVVMALLGTWGILGLGKVLEGRSLEATTRRLLYLGIGLLLGTAGLLFDQGFQLRPIPPGARHVLVGTGFTPGGMVATSPSEALEFLIYFAGLFLTVGWWKLAGRDRKARFRIWPLLVSALLAGVFWPFLPTAQPYGVAVAVLMATVTQLVSPWNEAAAAYARATRKRKYRAA